MTWILAAAEGGEAAAHAATFTDGGVLARWAGLMVIAPFVAFLLIVFFGKRLKWLGAEFAIGAMAFNWVYSVILFFLNVRDGIVKEVSLHVADIGVLAGGHPLAIEWGWVVDGLSVMMYLVVSTVALLVFIYAVGYMHEDVRVTWFFASLSLFAGSMLVLVSAPNLVQLIVGWEGVGLASYLLIGHYWEQKENSSAGMKAFYVNKVADVGLIIGAIVLGLSAGSFRISEILAAVEHGAGQITTVAAVGAGLLFIGAMGKSAQFPLHVWLPDAMAGPTPVSALMHAATMVTAGVYLVARMFPLYEGVGAPARHWVLVAGGVTLFAAGLLAIVQDDIKKVLAYSTVSQLGYMMAALGAGAYTAGLFHLWTHAFFKSLLFLGAGAVIHAVHSNNMSDMGGLRKHMPITYWTFVIGSLALAGIPPLAGFFSKDEILVGLKTADAQLILWLGIGGAFITAFYMARTVFLTFHGSYKGHGHPHEAPAIMTGPLVVLGILSIVAGWVNIPGVFTGFGTWVTTRAEAIVEHHATGFDVSALLSGVIAASLGILLGYLLYFRDAETQAERDTFRIPGLWPLLQHKYYLDDLYWYGVVVPIKGPLARFVDWFNTYILDGIVNGVALLSRGLAKVVYGGLDQRGIDMIFNGMGAGADELGVLARKLQTGRVQQYAASVVGGLIVLTAAILFFR